MSDPDETFRRLYEKYFDAVVGYLIRFGFEREQARDLAQDVFFRVYRNMDEWHGAEWMYLKTVAKRTALNEFRRVNTLKRAASTVTLDDESVVEPASDDPNAEEEMVSRANEDDRVAKLEHALAALSPRLRAPLLMRLEGTPYKEIARLLHLNLNVVKTRLYEAKAELRRLVGTAAEEVDDDDA